VYRPRRELNKIGKRGRPSDIKVGVFVPLPYRAAMNSLFLHLCYRYFAELDGVIVNRFVYNINEDAVESLDYNTNIKDMDLLLVSLPFEIDYVYAIRAFMLEGVLKEGPIKIAGGIAPSANPLPIAPFFDAIVIGDAEPFLERFTDILQLINDRSSFIDALASVEGVYVPKLGRYHVKRTYVQNLDEAFYPYRQLVPLDEEPVYGRGLLLEASRGCPYSCPFCLEGFTTKPFRYRSKSKLIELVEKGIEFTRPRKVIFYSLSLFSVPGIDEVLLMLKERGIKAGIPSVRIDTLNDERIRFVVDLGQRTLTIAPETLIPNLAQLLGKNTGYDEVIDITVTALRSGIRNIKLYLIAGFGNELDGLLLEMLSRFVEEVGKKTGIHPSSLRFSINPLIPKPNTPLQWLPPKVVFGAAKTLGKIRHVIKGRARVEVYDVWWSFAQAVIGLGDERVSKLILNWALHSLGIGGFKRAYREYSKELEHVEKGWSDPPWSFIESYVPYSELRKRFSCFLESLEHLRSRGDTI